MSKAVLISVIVGGVVVVGGGVYYYTTMPTEAELAHNALLGDGSVTCTFTDLETGDTGTMYVRDGDVFVDTTTTRIPFDEFEEDEESVGEEVQAYMLFQDNVMHIWTDGEAEGLKLSLEDLDEYEDMDEHEMHFRELLENEERFEEIYEEYNYSCERGVRNEVFTLPEDIEFYDLNELMQPFMDMVEDSTPDFGDNEELEEWEQIIRDFEENAPTEH